MCVLQQLKRSEGKEEADSWLENALSGKKLPMNPGRGPVRNQEPYCMVTPPEGE